MYIAMNPFGKKQVLGKMLHNTGRHSTGDTQSKRCGDATIMKHPFVLVIIPHDLVS